MRSILVAFGLLCILSGAARAEGERELARQHFLAGQARWKAGDLHGAILEFAAADALVPSPILSYDIAVCHDRLGEIDEAIGRYEEYLKRRPDAPNRKQIEARLAALEPPVEPAPPETVPTRPPAGEDGLVPPRSADQQPVPGVEPRRVPYDEPFARLLPGPAAAQAPEPATAPPPPRRQPELQARGPEPLPPPGMPGPEPPRSKPFYKQWWFWVFVGVGAVIVIDVAASHSSTTVTQAGRPAPTGLTLFNF